MRAGGVFKIRQNRRGLTLRYGAEIAALQMPLNCRRRVPEVQQRLSINEKKLLKVVVEFLDIQHARLTLQRDIRNLRTEVRQEMANPKPIRLSDPVRMVDILDSRAYFDRIARIEAQVVGRLGERERCLSGTAKKLNAKILRRKETIQRRDG